MEFNTFGMRLTQLYRSITNISAVLLHALDVDCFLDGHFSWLGWQNKDKVEFLARIAFDNRQLWPNVPRIGA